MGANSGNDPTEDASNDVLGKPGLDTGSEVAAEDASYSDCDADSSDTASKSLVGPRRARREFGGVRRVSLGPSDLPGRLPLARRAAAEALTAGIYDSIGEPYDFGAINPTVSTR